ncbi:DHH family protein [Biscogniauxia sp. FL1348]|nr:DHH family protein [Biscogniauxia sp. FL1348]
MKGVWRNGLFLRIPQIRNGQKITGGNHHHPYSHLAPSSLQARLPLSTSATAQERPQAKYGSFTTVLLLQPKTMKRLVSTATEAKATPTPPSKAKRPKVDIPAYHLTPSLVDPETGEIIWPAPADQMSRARDFILECVAAQQRTLIVPDKDADGLSSGAILRRTLILLGLDPALISAHLMQKGSNVHAAAERAAMAAHKPSYIFVLDQGSLRSPPIIDAPHKALVIDHHWAQDDTDFPEGALHVSACRSPPVATTALLTYTICTPLHADVPKACDWLCAMGTHGDLGTSIKWEPPFPDMKATFKTYTKTAINTAVSLINAPRRTAAYGVPGAWAALTAADVPSDLLTNADLLAARAEVNAEVARCSHAPPSFSRDGRIAVFRISSAAQIHNVIAMRWAGFLQAPRLEAILVANEGYIPGMVNFSCRIPRCAKTRDPPVNLLQVLRDVVDRAESPTLRERVGESFARGHKEASGGIVPKAEFEELMDVLRVRKKIMRTTTMTTKAKNEVPGPLNTITNYFGKQETG